MAKSNKIQQLLEQKAKLEEMLKAEIEKRYIEIGKLAKKHNILEWSNDELENAFIFIKEQGKESFANKNDETAKSNQSNTAENQTTTETA
jgi:membrane-bound lytic murein transglycosylase